MKRSLWIASGVAVLALPALGIRAAASSSVADLGNLQKAIKAASVAPLENENCPQCAVGKCPNFEQICCFKVCSAAPCPHGVHCGG